MSYTPTGFIRQSDGAILAVGTADAVTQLGTAFPALPALPPGPLLPTDGFVVNRTIDGVSTDYQATLAGMPTSRPYTVVASSGASQSLAYPAGGDAAFDVTVTANCSFALAGGVAGQYQEITLIARQDATGGRTITLPSGVLWPGGAAPVPDTTPNAVNVFTFGTGDARTTVIGGYRS